MIEDAVSRAKFLQDQKCDVISSLRPDISKFHLDLVEGIKLFITLAKEKEIDGVSVKNLKDLGEGVREFCFQVDDNNLALAMREEVYPLDFKDECLGNNAYLYYDGDPSDTPIIEISLYKNSNDEKLYSVSWFTTNEKKPITGNEKLNNTAGKKAAEAIVRFFYNQSKRWKSAPTREGFCSQKSKKGKMGFLEE
jgi:hypothetical protein